MKLTRIIITALAASALLFTACDKKDGGGAVSEKDAIAAFKKSAEELNAVGNAPADPGDPTGMGKMKVIMAKMNAIKTDGLPADLKDAFTKLRAKLTEMAGLVADMPEKPEERLAWAQKMMADPALGQKMGAIGQEVTTLGETLTTVAKKYDINVDVSK